MLTSFGNIGILCVQKKDKRTCKNVWWPLFCMFILFAKERPQRSYNQKWGSLFYSSYTLALFMVGHIIHFDDATNNLQRRHICFGIRCSEPYLTTNRPNKSFSHGVNLMQKALHTKQEKVMRAAFFNNCGYALVWAGRHMEASVIFKIAADHDLFPSFMQRSVHNIKTIVQ